MVSIEPFSYIERNVHVENYIELLSLSSRDSVKFSYVGIAHSYMHKYFMSIALVPILRYVAFTGMNVQLYFGAVKGLV